MILNMVIAVIAVTTSGYISYWIGMGVGYYHGWQHGWNDRGTIGRLPE